MWQAEGNETEVIMFGVKGNGLREIIMKCNVRALKLHLFTS